MTNKIVKWYSQAFKRQVDSEFENGETVDDSATKFAFSAPVRIWLAYILFQAGFFAATLIFQSGETLKVLLNLELAVLFGLWAIFGERWGKRDLRWFASGFGLFYALALVYSVYASALIGLYQREANFFNDFSFVIGGMSFLLDALNLSLWVYLAGGTAIIVLLGLIFWGVRATFEGVPIVAVGRVTRFGLIGLGLIAIIVEIIFPKISAEIQIPVSSLTAEITSNIHRSLESRESLKSFAAFDPMDTYNYAQYALSETPDVYFIFFESYGSVVYKRQHFRQAYLEMAERLENRLANDGWSAISTLSEAPTWGGGSWMSYTSALFGLSIEQQREYDMLKEKYSVLEYPNIGRYFSSQGYEYVWVVPIDRRMSKKLEAIDHNFYGAEQWITFETLKYDGPLFGWGPSVPDQFTFGFIQEFVQKQERPTFIVYLTQNSHFPWTPLPPIFDDWHKLTNLNMEDGVLSEAQKKGLSWHESRQNYLQAVENTFECLEVFITSLENENSVIVLIGDHQPPTVSRREDGFETMVHIISQDVDFLASFQDYGFVNGVVLENLTATLRHAGLYSLFVRNFVARYGKSPWNLPAYLPDGYP